MKAGVGERRSLKLLGMASETTRRTRAMPKTTSLNTSRRVMESPRRRKLSLGDERDSIFQIATIKTRSKELRDGHGARTWLGDRSVHVQDRSDEVAQGHSEMAYNALLEGSVVLRPAEEIGHELAEDGAATHELNHTCGDGGTEEGAAIKAADDACGEFEFAGKSGANP